MKWHKARAYSNSVMVLHSTRIKGNGAKTEPTATHYSENSTFYEDYILQELKGKDARPELTATHYCDTSSFYRNKRKWPKGNGNTLL